MIGRTPPEPRKGARSRADIPPETLELLHLGSIPTATLSEALAIDFARLMQNVLPRAEPSLHRAMRAQAGEGIVRRMETAGALLLEPGARHPIEELQNHPSDIVRGWCAYARAAAIPFNDFEAAIAALRPFAADPHFAVREWAWMALRPRVVEQPRATLSLLQPWTADPDPNIRRFASEATRPRGVWCPMVRPLVEEPSPGLAILEPMRSDPAEYVRLSVANWINDASKSRPDWARAVIGRWLKESPTPETQAIAKRALRTLNRKTPTAPPRQ